jgi:hypothetical protein
MKAHTKIALALVGTLGGALAAMAIVAGSEAPAAIGPAPGGPPASAPLENAPFDAGWDAGPPSFVAFARDFAGFRSWERHAVRGAMVPIGAAPGPTFVYVNRRAPAGAHRWPVGTILIKTIETGAPHEWTIHAMVKRGVPYNARGAIGWEFFELRLPENGGDPVVVWRGPGPPTGHGYAAIGRDAGSDPIPLVCNDCHAAAWQSDGVLTPSLALAW